MHIGLTELPASSLHFLQLLLTSRSGRAVKSLEMSAGRDGVLGKSGTLHLLIDGILTGLVESQDRHLYATRQDLPLTVALTNP